jgi:hypothetical protein
MAEKLFFMAAPTCSPLQGARQVPVKLCKTRADVQALAASRAETLRNMAIECDEFFTQ